MLYDRVYKNYLLYIKMLMFTGNVDLHWLNYYILLKVSGLIIVKYQSKTVASARIIIFPKYCMINKDFKWMPRKIF